MPDETPSSVPVRTRIEEIGPGTLQIRISGRLDAKTTGRTWLPVMRALAVHSPRHAVMETSGLEYCDISGVALFLEAERRQKKSGGTLEIAGLRPQFQQLLGLFDPVIPQDREPEKGAGFAAGVGRVAFRAGRELGELISFLGELTTALASAARHPGSVRWADTLVVAVKAGVDAVPIVALISFLVGLIMAFQSAVPMRQFGAEIFVADLVALSMLRELGPLMTAIILAGRSGSAFAAEIGTMKINEEIDALITMGLDPVRFLAVARVVAAMAMAPLLSVFADLLGVLGGSVVLVSMGYSVITYFDEVVYAANWVDFAGGISKSIAFGFIVGGIGCVRGLQTKTGAVAVGDSTTKAVVSGIILIVAADGVFAVIYYYLGI